MVMFLLAIPRILLTEHVYVPVVVLTAPVMFRSTLTLLTLPTPVDDDNAIASKGFPSLSIHTTVGGG